MNTRNTRREFLGLAAAAVAGANLLPKSVFAQSAADKPALLGGTPVHTGGWPQWPEWRQSWEPSILQVLRSGRWYRGTGEQVQQFETAYAKLLGAKRCLATASGTTALIVGMHVLDVDAGDEVIVSPFTFIASYNAVLIRKALPVLADTDPATLTIDPASIESRITDRTRAIMPVHIYGMPCDMDPIVCVRRETPARPSSRMPARRGWPTTRVASAARSANLAVSASRTPSTCRLAKGGAITGSSDDLIDRCGFVPRLRAPVWGFKGARPNFTRGGNFRMQHFQAAMLLQQFDKLVQDTARRRENADRLTASLKEIPGIQPARLPDNSRAVWHLYPFRYDAEKFQGLPRDKFIRAMRAEGIPCSTGYQEQYFDGLLDEAINSRGYKRLFSAARLKAYRDSFQELKGNRQVCETTVAVTQNLLLARPTDIDHIGAAIRKIQAHGAALGRA